MPTLDTRLSHCALIPQCSLSSTDSTAAVVHDVAGSCREITQAVLHPWPFTQPCQNSQVSTHGLSMTLSFTVGLEGKTSYKNNCIQASKGVLSALSTHLAFVRFLKPLTKTDQATLLHWSQLAQISLNVISIQFVSWRKKKEQFRGDLA